ncbi:MAG: hypothetical protein SGILL_008166, partial [Bacillariaceae sp.]
WKHFVGAFQELDKNGIFKRCGADFGKRIQGLAEYVCEKTSPGPKDVYATISHGDFKSMNCFLPVDGNEASQKRGVVMVDFASIGVGLGMQDVAMHIHHASATPESFAKKATSKNTALINRDVDAAFAFLERVQKHVTKIEREQERV